MRKLKVELVEEYLKEIKDSELDIEILKRENEKLCESNVIKIAKLTSKIGTAEEILEKGLKKSGKDKIECKLGSVSFKKMPDEWKYQDEILMDWVISLPARLKNLYLKIATTIKKADLKKMIMEDNPRDFHDGKLIDYSPGLKLYIVGENDDYKVEGIEIKYQESKFSYTIKKLKK